VSTIACIGGGPSLTQADVDLLRGRCFVIAINDAYKLAPWADVLYACDAKWWNWHAGAPSFTGPKYALEQRDPIDWPGVTLLKGTGVYGLEGDPSGLRTGHNSGYQALNLAVHLGARRVLLLGFDLGVDDDGRTHWFGDHPDRTPSPYDAMLNAFETLVSPLAELGVDVLNCSRRTALTTFPIVRLEDVLATSVAAERRVAEQARGDPALQLRDRPAFAVGPRR